MTRREREILIASVSWTDKSLTVNEEKAFQAGARWADKKHQAFVELVKRMREARHRYSSLSREFCSKGMKPRQSQEWQDARKLTKQLESEVDEYLKKMEE